MLPWTVAMLRVADVPVPRNSDALGSMASALPVPRPPLDIFS
ncbi:hypothetical protein ACQPZK_19530 [Micromonospora sp. CA-249363]|jgi:hypothetical protein